MKKIKILYIVSTLKRSGPIFVLANIVKYLDRDKFDPIVLTLSPEPQDSLKTYFEDNLKTKVVTLGLSRIQGIFLAKKKLTSFIKENSVHIVHSHGLRSDSLASQLLNVKRISTLHNYPYYDYQMKFGKFKGRLMAKRHLAVIKRIPNANVACAKTIANEFKKNNLDLDYIQNGVDIDKFFPLTLDSKNELKKKLKIDLSKEIFVTVGSLIDRKDMKTVLSAFKNYRKENKVLFVLGDGPKKSELESIANEDIKILGSVPNVVEYLQISDCFISASLAEGLPNTVLEAMACGLPTILSNIPSHLELYENENGNFFEKKNIVELTKRIENIHSNLDIQKNVSLRLVDKYFSAKTMSNSYQTLYKLRLDGTV